MTPRTRVVGAVLGVAVAFLGAAALLRPGRQGRSAVAAEVGTVPTTGAPISVTTATSAPAPVPSRTSSTASAATTSTATAPTTAAPTTPPWPPRTTAPPPPTSTVCGQPAAFQTAPRTPVPGGSTTTLAPGTQEVAVLEAMGAGCATGVAHARTTSSTRADVTVHRGPPSTRLAFHIVAWYFDRPQDLEVCAFTTDGSGTGRCAGQVEVYPGSGLAEATVVRPDTQDLGIAQGEFRPA